MPIYTVAKIGGNGKTWELMGSYEEVKSICEEEGLHIVPQAVGFITQQTGGTMRKAGSEWNDRLKAIKKNAGRRSTINT